jgi:hypothetical protein
MSTETQEDVSHQSLRCCWPELFTKRRDFNRHTENQPYIKYCGTPLFYGEEHEDEDDEDDDEDGISSEDDDPLNKPEDEVEGHRDTLENQDETLNDDKGSESCNRYSNIRCFMTGMIGDEDSLEDHDQVDEVASFCEQPSFRENDSKSGQKALDGKHVALLDDMNIGGTIVDKKGHCRPYLEPLTWQELCEKLSKRVTQISCCYQNFGELTQLHSVSELNPNKLRLPMHLKTRKVTQRGD